MSPKEVRKIIREELDGPSCTSGYRAGIHFASNMAFVFPVVQCKVY